MKKSDEHPWKKSFNKTKNRAGKPRGDVNKTVDLILKSERVKACNTQDQTGR